MAANATASAAASASGGGGGGGGSDVFTSHHASEWALVLARAGVCPRCVLRFLNIRTFALYQSTPEVLMNKFAESKLNIVWSKDPCVACLGILQTETHVAYIVAEVKKLDYQIYDYCMCLTIPLSIPLRHWGLWHYIRHALGPSSLAFLSRMTLSTNSAAAAVAVNAVTSAAAGDYKHSAAAPSTSTPGAALPVGSAPGSALSPDGNTVDVKEALKWLIGRELASGLGVEFKLNAAFEINLVFRAAIDSAAENGDGDDSRAMSDATTITASVLAGMSETAKCRAVIRSAQSALKGNTGKGTHKKPAVNLLSGHTVIEALPFVSPQTFAFYGLCPPTLPDALGDDFESTKSKKTTEKEKRAARAERMPLQMQRKREAERTAGTDNAAASGGAGGDDDSGDDKSAESAAGNGSGSGSGAPANKKVKLSSTAAGVASTAIDTKSDSASAASASSSSSVAAAGASAAATAAAAAAADPLSAVSMPNEIRPPSITVLNRVVALELSVTHAPILLAGNYCKYSRQLSQSPWIMDGVRFQSSSVEEEIARHTVKHFGTTEYKFHSSGREDVDVRMLGAGRPFILELIEPHRAPRDPALYASMQAAINASSEAVEITNLHLSTREEFKALKDSVNTKRKTYRCVVWTAKAMPSLEHLRALLEVPASARDIKVLQQTPIRVLHRRSALTRTKYVYSMRVVEWVNRHWFVLDLSTSAGTYVKEFVHGDRGRTQPNVGSILGCDADIIQLDVTGLL